MLLHLQKYEISADLQILSMLNFCCDSVKNEELNRCLKMLAVVWQKNQAGRQLMAAAKAKKRLSQPR
jgi:hypothetical protein